MHASVVLQYRRVGHLSTGRVVHRTIQQEKPIAEAIHEEVVAEFEALEFKDMIGMFCAALRAFPAAHPVFERTDKPGIMPYFFDAKMAQLLREDPVMALRAMTVTDQSVDLRAAKPPQQAAYAELPYLKGGYDTFAESFGYEVYLHARAQGAEVECPLCGRWSKRAKTVLVCEFMRCQAVVAVTLCSSTWASVEVEALLQQPGAVRFYLPRAWNEGRAWIDVDVLRQKYNQFLEEVSCLAKVP